MISLAPDRFLWYSGFHHIVIDGVGLTLFCRRVAKIYTAGESAGGSPFGCYPDFLAEEAGYRGSPEFAEAQRYWADHLAAAPEPAYLAGGGTVASEPLRRSTSLTAEAFERLKRVAGQAGVRWYPLVLAAMAAYAARIRDTSDVLLTMPVAGRDTATGLSALTVTSHALPVRITVTPEVTWAELAAAAAGEVRGAMAHQRYRGEDVRRELLRHDGGPFFGPMVNAVPAGKYHFGTAVAELHHLSAPAVEDLAVCCFPLPDGGLRVETDAHPAHYSERELQTHHERFLRLLTRIEAAQPVGEADLLGTVEQQELLDASQGPVRATPDATPAELFTAQAARTPDAIAVESDRITLSYAELDARSTSLARRLVAAGVGSETLVPLLLTRSAHLVVAMLAVAKAGGAYVPLDPQYPLPHLRSILDDAGSPLLVVDQAFAGHELGRGRRVIRADVGREPAAAKALPGDSRADAAAYVMYTSGSTGKPKGVVVTRRNIVELATDQACRDGANGRVLVHSPHAFDASTYELWVPLLSAGTLVLAAGGATSRAPDAAALAGTIAERRVTALWLTSGLFSVLAEDHPACFSGVALVTTGGDVVSPTAVERVRRANPALVVANGYGPTETTTFATRHVVRELPGRTVPIGLPLDNTRAYVLDRRLRPVPPGVAGELYLAGAGLARGYLNQPGPTAERFVADPFGKPGERMYRTGDLVRRTEQGPLEFLGRADDQVKLRGFRIEPGAVEAAVSAQDGVGQVAVVVREDAPGDKRLVAYVVPAGEVDPARLRSSAEAELPGHMVPAAFVVLDRFPLTTNGKLDRRALPAPRYGNDEGRGPRTAAEETLCTLFAEVLGADRVGIDDDFFAVGGHSLLATRLIGRIRAALGIALPVRALFETPTVAQLATRLDEGGRPTAALTPRTRPEVVPLSYPQQRLWLASTLDDQDGTYHIPVAIGLTGPLDRAALRAAVADVVRRHESLRTVFPEAAGSARQQIVDSTSPLAERAVEPHEVPGAVAEIAARRFDLTRDLPIRAELLCYGEEEHVLVLVLHHVAADGWSLVPLARDLSSAYAARRVGERPKWTELPVQYADYTLWQRDVLGSADDPTSVLAERLAYWTDRLAGLPECLELLIDRPRPAAASGNGAETRFAIDARLHEGVRQLAEAHGATVFMVLQAAFAALLTRLGAGTDIPVGVADAGRTDPALEDLVGCFVSTWVLRTDTAGDPSFAELIGRVREATLASLPHRDTPFEHLVARLAPQRSAAHHPLFQVALGVQDGAEPRFELPGLDARAEFTTTGRARFDLFVTVTENFGENGAAAGLSGWAEYATDLFDAATVDALAARWIRVLEAVVADPHQPIGRPALLSLDELEQLRRGWCEAERDVPGATLPELFEAEVERNPDAVALVGPGFELTYAELNARANRFARMLTGRRIGPEQTVALALPRSAGLIIGLLGVSKAGAAYLPIDLAYPGERVAYLIEDADPALLVTTAEYQPPADVPVLMLDDLPPLPGHNVTDDERTSPLSRRNLAYVVYTSGSTGRPKGVGLTHDGIASLRQEFLETAGIGPGSRVPQLMSPSFDASLGEILGTLLTGATLVLPPPDNVFGDELAEFAAEHRLTHAMLPPAMVSGLNRLPAGITLLVSGDVCTPALVADWAPGRRMINGYGPTEVTVGATMHRCRPEDAVVPIGRAFRNKRVYVLDERLRLAPPGVVGELYVAGAGLARGYLNRPGLTAERFVADPFGGPGDRMYRTGDLGRWNARGELEFAGRADDQVKIRGFRVEPAEIESVLADDREVRQAAVVVREDAPGVKRLVAYVVGEPDPRALRARVAERLPEYLVPAAIVGLDRLPLTPNGKLDRRALPAPEHSGGRVPRTPREEVLCGLFAEALGLPGVGIDDGFFDLGGHSLLAIRLVNRVNAVLGTELSVRTLFGAPTVAGLMDRIRTGGEDDAFGPVLALRTGGRHAPLFCVPPVIGLSWTYAGLLTQLSADFPVYGLQARGLDGGTLPGSVEETVTGYVGQILRIQPHGPYHLLGWSFGGMIAHAVAARLRRLGHEVGLLALLDSAPAEPETFARTADVDESTSYLQMLEALGIKVPAAERAGFTRADFLRVARASHGVLAELEERQVGALMDVTANNRRIILPFRHERIAVEAVLFIAAKEPDGLLAPDVWNGCIAGTVEACAVASDHLGMTTADSFRTIGPVLERKLRQLARVEEAHDEAG